MSAIAEAPGVALRAPRRPRPANVLLTLARRRASLTSKTPRQILVPLLGPALLALVVAPALKAATGGMHSHIDYTSLGIKGPVHRSNDSVSSVALRLKAALTRVAIGSTN
jgi:hypothetical protein